MPIRLQGVKCFREERAERVLLGFPGFSSTPLAKELKRRTKPLHAQLLKSVEILCT